MLRYFENVTFSSLRCIGLLGKNIILAKYLCLGLSGEFSMQQQRDAILGYADQQQSYFIRFIENHQVVGDSYTLASTSQQTEDAEQIMTLLYLKKTFWLNGANFQDIIKGLQSITVL